MNGIGGIAFLLESFLDEAGNFFFVFYDEDAHHDLRAVLYDIIGRDAQKSVSAG